MNIDEKIAEYQGVINTHDIEKQSALRAISKLQNRVRELVAVQLRISGRIEALKKLTGDGGGKSPSPNEGET
jgi:hypothetical protein